MVRDTSIEAYNYIRHTEFLSKRRWQVYDCLFQQGPMTAREVKNKFLSEKMADGSLSTRFSELQRMGLVYEVGKKKNKETGMSAILWDVTPNFPKKLERKITLKTQLEIAKELLTKNNLLEDFNNLTGGL